MDRIYYFMIAKEEAGYREQHGDHICATIPKLPIFRKEVGPYEVYYLQMFPDVENSEFAGVQAYMQKGIRRISGLCDRETGGDASLSYDGEDKRNACLVYDRDFEKWLVFRKKDGLWQKLWNLPLYHEYKEAHNLTFLLQQIPVSTWPGQLIILGEAPGMADWLGMLARHMKCITIYALAEPRGFETVRARMLEEYGLLTDWQKSLQPAAGEPALVLGYSGKDKIYAWDIVPGSIWIDMMSMEERRHALEDRETGVRYVSLKSIWREEMRQTLDTIGKIQYNIRAKLEGKVDYSQKPHKAR